jgi:hypothetical protein
MADTETPPSNQTGPITRVRAADGDVSGRRDIRVLQMSMPDSTRSIGRDGAGSSRCATRAC